MKFKKTLLFIKNKRGGALVLTMMFISVILLTFIVMASLSLSQTVAHVARANAKVIQLNVAQDIGQALTRAYVLGKGTCPTGTTAVSRGGVRFCIPDDGVTNRTGLQGVCVDLDQDRNTTHDQYCITTMTAVTEFKKTNDEEPSYVASLLYKFSQRFNAFIVGMDSANAQCTWFSCPDPTTAGAAAQTNVRATEDANIPGDYGPEPTGSAVESTGGTLSAHHNLELWFPDADWTETNEIMTPNCSSANQYWLGCVDCTSSAFSCMEFTVCPARNLSCPASERMTQGIAFY